MYQVNKLQLIQEATDEGFTRKERAESKESADNCNSLSDLFGYPSKIRYFLNQL